MRILVVTARYPALGGKGDQVRTFSFLERLADRHELTIVTAGRPPDDGAARRLEALGQVVATRTGTIRRAAGALSALLVGTPVQTAWMMPRRIWRDTKRLAAGHDVALISTVRAMRGPLPIPTVLDHVDTLSLNMRRRTGLERKPWLRLAASIEHVLLKRLERRAARWVVAQVVTSQEDAGHLPQRPEPLVLPVGWVVPTSQPAAQSAGRDIDLIFTGTMTYPPNASAARLVAEHIVPRVRAQLPEVSAWIVGRGADSLGLESVYVASDVPDLYSYLQRARVAVVPLEGGTGSPFKVLEAAASGAAVVSRPWALRVFEMDGVEADTPAEFAASAIRLLTDEEYRSQVVRRSQPAVEAHRASTLAERLEDVLSQAAERRSP